MGVQPQALGPEVVADGCDWPAVARLTVDPEWASGYYEVVLTHDGQGPEPVEAVAFFVVRPTETDPARPLLVLATNTWCAYNDVGGQNLYRSFDVPPSPVASFRRPMARGFLRRVDGPGSRVAVVDAPDPTMTAHVTLMLEEGYSSWFGSAGWSGWEGPFVAWAEGEGYGLDYAANADLVEHPELLDGRRLVLSVGHDEYWTGGMRDAIEGFARDGGNVAFLSGNTACWQVRIEDDGQTLVGYKEAFHDDPVLGTDRQGRLTTLWSDALLGRPENAMTGVSFIRGGYHRIGRNVGRGAGGYTVQRPEHWVFEGTGVTYGDLIGADAVTVGYECDGCHIEVRRRPAVPDRLRRHAVGLRDPRPRTRGALRPPQRAPARPRGRAVRDRALRQPGPRWPRSRRGRPAPARPRGDGRPPPRRHRLHRRHHRVALGLRQPRPDHRADHPQPPGPAHVARRRREPRSTFAGTAGRWDDLGVRHARFDVAYLSIEQVNLPLKAAYLLVADTDDAVDPQWELLAYALDDAPARAADLPDRPHHARRAGDGR